MKSWCLVLAAVVVVEAATGKSLDEWEATKIENILSQVPRENQKDFLRFHLQKGHHLREKPEFDYEISDGESVLIYDYFSKYKLVEDEEVIKEVQDIICWGDKCIDFSDPGVHP